MTRRALAGVWAIAALPVLLLLLQAMPAQDRVPTHWTERADGWSSGVAFGTTCLTVVALAAVVAAAVAVLRRIVPGAWSRWLVAAASAVGWGAVAVYAVTVWRTGIDGADGVGGGWPFLALGGGVLAGAVGYAVHGLRMPPLEQVRERVPERARVQPSGPGRSVPGPGAGRWTTTARSITLTVIGVLVLLTGIALAAWLWVDSGWAPGLVVLVVMVLTGGLALAWSRIRMSVDAGGLEVRSQLVPVRLAHVPAVDVLGAEDAVLDPMEWGGWGLRALPDRTAYIVDGGPGLVVWKRDGRRLALQVTEGDEQARAGARALREAAGQALGVASGS